MKKLLLALLAALVVTSVGVVGQTNPAGSTTNSVAISATDTVITLASASGVVDNYGIYINGEYMVVNPSWTSGTQVPVFRGQLGTVAKAHPASQTAVIGPPAMFSTADPGAGSSSCPSTPAPYLVQVNVVSGDIWLCRWIGAARVWTATNQRLLTYNSINIG